MKAVLVSDSHGDRACLDWLRKNHSDADVFIHCGDLQMFAEEAPGFICVRGNTDFDPALPWARVEEFEGHKVLICHGHAYIDPFDPADPLGLTSAAKRSGCGAVFFGHTHVSCDIEYAGIRLINPGSIRRPKDFRFPYPTYMLLTITEEGIEAQRMIYNPNPQE